MPTLTILGLEVEVRGLTALELTRWNSHLMLLAARLHWSELYERVESLPGRLQEVVFANSPVPEKLNRQQYFDLATRVESVNYLISMIVDEPSIVLESLTAETAPEIFWTVQPLILNHPVVLPAGEGLAKLREGAGDARLS